jgi:hypothetical protein
MIPAIAMMASRIKMTIAVAGRTTRSYDPERGFNHSVRFYAAPGGIEPHRRVRRRKMPRPPNGGGGLGYMKDGSPPWGGLGGYPFTSWERALDVRGGTNPSCMRRLYRPRRVRT